MDWDAVKPILAGLVRHAITTAAGALVTDGVLQSNQVNGAVGAVMLLIGIAWSWYQKRGQADVTAAFKKLTAGK